MINSIKCKFFIEDAEENIIGAHIIERNGVACDEITSDIYDAGNKMATCCGIVLDEDYEIDENQVFTITVEC